MIRRLLNRSLDGLFVSGLTPAWLRRLEGKVLCLVYHRVSDDPPGFLEWGGVPTISTTELRTDLAYLKAGGGRFFTLEDLRSGARPDRAAPNFVITFDDGFRDTYENGLGVLDELGIKGVVFQVAELIDGNELNWEHDLYRYAWQTETRDLLEDSLKDVLPDATDTSDIMTLVKTARDTVSTPRVMTVLENVRARVGDGEERKRLAGRLYPKPSALQAARRAGHEIGSHGKRHVARRFLTADEFRRDASESGSLIEEAAGAAPRAYAYPFGCHQAGDREILDDLYDQAVITIPGPLDLDEPYALRRCPWPGPARNELRRRRWLLTGHL